MYGTRANVLFSISPSTLLKTVGDKSIYLYTSPFNLNLIFPRPLFHFFLCNSQSDCPHLSLIKKKCADSFHVWRMALLPRVLGFLMGRCSVWTRHARKKVVLYYLAHPLTLIWMALDLFQGRAPPWDFLCF